MEEKQHIGQLFDRIAATYDGLNHGLSLNIDRCWRRKTVKHMQPAEHVLDVAIGTADLTIEMFRQGITQQVTGLDLSDKMMAIGEAKCAKRKLNTTFVRLWCEVRRLDCVFFLCLLIASVIGFMQIFSAIRNKII